LLGTILIILDTNRLDVTPLDSLTFAMLRSIARESRHELGISAVTLDEHLTHYTREVRKPTSRIISAYKDLRRLDRRVEIPNEKDMNEEADELIADHEREIKETFRILAVTGESAIEALRREARRIPPASIDADSKGTGARDVAIWLSAVQHSANVGEKVFILSEDKAFKTALSCGDLEKYGGDVEVVKDIPSLLDLLAARTHVDASLRTQCDSQTVRDAVIMSFGFYDTLSKAVSTVEPARAGITRYEWSSVPVMDLLEVLDTHGYTLQNSTWITVRTKWLVELRVCITVRDPEENEHSIARLVKFRVTASVLLNIGPKAIGVDVISISDPTSGSSDIVPA
jgi:PIN domain